jgi:hypothetical protein
MLNERVSSRAFWQSQICQGSSGGKVVTSFRGHISQDHGLRRRKLAPRGPLEAFRPALTRRNDRGQPPEQANILFVGGCMVYGPQKAPMLRRRIIAVTNEHFGGHKPFNPPQKVYSLARGVVTDHSDALAQGARPLVGL